MLEHQYDPFVCIQIHNTHHLSSLFRAHPSEIEVEFLKKKRKRERGKREKEEEKKKKEGKIQRTKFNQKHFHICFVALMKSFLFHVHI